MSSRIMNLDIHCNLVNGAPIMGVSPIMGVLDGAAQQASPPPLQTF